MADYYLNKLGLKLPSLQGHQIVRTLSNKKEKGEIRTLDSLKDKLKELTDVLLKNQLKPSLKVYVAEGKGDISSETYNDMTEHIEDDLVAAFTEADNLYEIMDSHNTLIKGVALQGIEVGLNHLEAQLVMYEFLYNSEHGCDSAIFDTFRDTSGSFIGYDLPIANFVYVDPKAMTLLSASNVAVVDVVGERLTLGTNLQTYIQPRGAEHLGGTYSTRTELDVSFSDSHILNIIDNKKDTFWVYPILCTSPLYYGAYAEIAIDLPSAQDISFVEIEPATDKPMTLVAIGYFDKNKSVRYLTIGEEVLNKEQARINFSTINTSRIILRFLQKNYKDSQFKRTEVSNINDIVKRSIASYSFTGSVDEDVDVKNGITSTFLLDTTGLTANPIQDSLRYYEYTVGLDNIRVGTSSYREVGIYALNKKTIDDLRLIALRTQETRPVQEYGEERIVQTVHTYPARTLDEDKNFYHGSVEYWANVEFYNKQGTAVETIKTFPLLPLNASRIYHEQLTFSKKLNQNIILNDSGSLTHFLRDDIADVVVYKNMLPIPYGLWLFVEDGHYSGLTVATPGMGERMRRGIKIVDRTKPSDRYTVSYTPLRSTSYSGSPSGATLLNTVDLSGDYSVLLMKNNTVIIDPTKISSTAGGVANVYLSIIIRRNSPNTRVSPAVEEVLLATRSGNSLKLTV